MQPASRASLATARERLDTAADGLGADELTRLGEELYAVAGFLDRERGLRRTLADHGSPAESRKQLIQRLLEGKVGDRALEAVTELVASRWSRPLDLVDAVEELAGQAVFSVAEGDSSLDEVEDELFTFGRVLDAQPRLATLLADEHRSADDRVELLTTLLDDRARPATRTLLEHAVRSPRRRALEGVVDELVNRAAARRERYVAHVTAAAPLTEQQESRLLDALDRIYRRPISLQAEIDPDLLGGLVIRVGDEVIDGSLSGRLERARQWLPH